MAIMKSRGIGVDIFCPCGYLLLVDHITETGRTRHGGVKRARKLYLDIGEMRTRS